MFPFVVLKAVMEIVYFFLQTLATSAPILSSTERLNHNKSLGATVHVDLPTWSSTLWHLYTHDAVQWLVILLVQEVLDSNILKRVVIGISFFILHHKLGYISVIKVTGCALDDRGLTPGTETHFLYTSLPRPAFLRAFPPLQEVSEVLSSGSKADIA
jgi:hypothetical protein